MWIGDTDSGSVLAAGSDGRGRGTIRYCLSGAFATMRTIIGIESPLPGVHKDERIYQEVCKLQ